MALRRQGIGNMSKNVYIGGQTLKNAWNVKSDMPTLMSKLGELLEGVSVRLY
jgi:hypothetical protein